MAASASEPTLEVIRASDLGSMARREVRALFGRSYQDADADYLDRSFETLRFLATARVGDELVGFALGDLRTLDLPRLPEQAVALAGICCVDPRHRRRGLFRRLEQTAFSGAGDWPEGRVLSCGRIAHPAAFRTISWNPTHVPRCGVPPTAWQQEVGSAVARAYGVITFDPETFVCRGSGRPIGRPVIDVEAEPAEWELFAPVDRSRGDALLGLCWTPDAPAGW